MTRIGSETSGAKAAGMFDRADWPRKIAAKVVTAPPDPRVHGYATESDLARHYPYSDILYLALTGELPSQNVSRGFAVVLAFLAAVPIHEGPTHAASLARLCNAPPRAAFEVAAVGLAERGHHVISGLKGFLEWLETNEAVPPPEFRTSDEAETQSVARLRAALPADLRVPALSLPITRTSALAAVLHACGLRRNEQLEAIWSLASLAATFAEAMATKPLSFREYPMNTPAFNYEDDE